MVPGSDDDVTINAPGTYTITVIDFRRGKFAQL